MKTSIPKKPQPGHSLADLNPTLATQWHPIKNGTLTPRDVTVRSHQIVWWKCPVSEDHEWRSTVNNRKRNGCGCCRGKVIVLSNCLATLRPDVAAQWHPTKNGKLTPNDVTVNSGRKVWWKCSLAQHEWETNICTRSGGHGCPKCNESKGERKVAETLEALGIN